jgi:ATP-binding cassette, subfamily F, member 3
MLEARAMLHINDLTYRIDGRLLIDHASAAIPTGHKVGLVGRNGSGKTTLLHLITGELVPESGGITVPRNARIGTVAQEAPGGSRSLIDTVLAADTRLAALMAEADQATDAHRIAEIQLLLTDISAHSAPARAATILAGLGFDEAAQARPCAEFSGGWRMRVALAAILFVEPDVLLLDEPTNYLDLEGTIWLESYLKSYPHTVLIVSHDRDLLNKAVEAILHLDQGKLTYYSGGYDRFERTRREQQAVQLKLKKKQEDARRHMQDYVDRFRYKANKARQAQSRLKALARMEPVAAMVDERVVPFVFPSPAKAMSPPLIRFEDAAVGYVADRPVLRNITLRLDPDDRIGLLGANGNGKSTFAKLLARRLSAADGLMSMSRKVEIGYFAQHQLDELNPSQSPYDHIRELMPEATEAQVRARLGALGFGIGKADTKADNLSGGEKARLLFALASFGAPHLLILDEPTNHLDVDSREALVRAINDYEGAVVLISHDRHLIETCADRLWLVADGTVTPYDGDIEEYRRSLLDLGRRKQAGGAERLASRQGSTIDRAEQKRRDAEARARVAPLKRKVEALEAKIAAAQAELARIDGRLADTAFYDRYPDAAAALVRERGECAKKLSRLEHDWYAASEAFEDARQAS